jgi:uncharacterized protein YqeY
MSIVHPILPDARVLDLCAGTGALGLESLSRGAAACDFVEQSLKVIKVLQAEAKKRMESAEVYEQNGRADAAANEKAEAEVLMAYLPAAMSDEELTAIVSAEVAAAAANGNTGMKAMGAVVKAVRERAGSSADGSKIADLVKAALA